MDYPMAKAHDARTIVVNVLLDLVSTAGCCTISSTARLNYPSLPPPAVEVLVLDRRSLPPSSIGAVKIQSQGIERRWLAKLRQFRFFASPSVDDDGKICRRPARDAATPNSRLGPSKV